MAWWEEERAVSKHGSERVARTKLDGCPLMPILVLGHTPLEVG